MALFSRAWNVLSLPRRSPLPYSRQEWEAASGIADLATTALGQHLSAAEKEVAVMMVHYGTATASAVLYSSIVPRQVRRSVWSGALFGSAMWLIANGLLSGPLRRAKTLHSYEDQAQALAEHVVYGLTVALVCRSFQ
jgi:uncharacterized membrane protein YagU involved in acid resistance